MSANDEEWGTQTTLSGQTLDTSISPLSAFQYETLDQYLRGIPPFTSQLRHPLWLALVAYGDRRAAWVNLDCTGISGRDLQQWCEEAGIAHRRFEEKRGHLISANAKRFELLPEEGAEMDTFRRSMGEFLDYPPEAISAHVDTSVAGPAYRTLDVRRGVFDAGTLSYLALVPYTPERSLSGYERAIAEGQAAADRLRTFAAVWNLPELAEMVQTCLNNEYGDVRPDPSPGSLERLKRRFDEWPAPLLEDGSNSSTEGKS